jgi:hypothetical protein
MDYLTVTFTWPIGPLELRIESADRVRGVCLDFFNAHLRSIRLHCQLVSDVTLCSVEEFAVDFCSWVRSAWQVKE